MRNPVATAVVAVALCLLFTGLAMAQTVTFTLQTVTDANGQVVPTLTWDSAASGCVASGAWSGARPASGTETLPATSVASTYSIECTFPGDDRAELSWTPPTANTDGSPYTDPKGYIINYGSSPDALTSAQAVNSPSATTATITGLAAGVYHFCVRAVNSFDMTSGCSNVASKVVSGPETIRQDLFLKKPNSPSGLTAQ
jgi:hypothetical protein